MDIQVKNDFTIDLATAHSRVSKKWRNRHWQWSELLQRCSETKRTGETAAEYARMTREEQSNVKDVGGFVGGYLSQGIRKNTNVMYRSVATLDIDYGTLNVWDDFTLAFDFAAMLYSTHKHSAKTPRYRLVFPLSRQVSPAEYEPLCRKIAAEIGIDLFDDTTYELPRLFYWPSTSKDADYVFEYQDGPACDVDAVLAQYVDYRDVSAWPISSREGDVIAHEMKKAGDPLEKPGIIGAFCRAYTIEEVIEKFLSDKYEPTAQPDRYTYKLGSVAGGLVCYEGKFAYSHHETDPASRQLCNAFDLCRIHLYGAQDEGSRAQDVTRRPSYAAMQEFAASDKAVKLVMARDKQKEVADDFGGVEVPEDYCDEWKAEMENTKVALNERCEILEEKKGELDKIVLETKQDEEKLRIKAKKLEEKIEPRLLSAFKRIRKNVRNGLGIVCIQRKSCGGCFNRIPPQRQSEIRMHKKIIQCEYCGRIMIDPELAGIAPEESK